MSTSLNYSCTQTIATHTLVHVAESDGFRTVLITGTLEQCAELLGMSSLDCYESGSFEIVASK